MKKLLCVLMFGMVFGQGELTTRVYEIEMNLSMNETMFFDIEYITGYDIENALINVFSIDNLTITVDEYNLEGWGMLLINNNTYDALGNSIGNHKLIDIFTTGATRMNEKESFRYSSINSHYIQATYADFSGTLKLAITAEFPEEQEDTDFAMGGGLTRSYTLDVSNGDFINFESITGYSLPWYSVEIANVNGGSWNIFKIQCISSYCSGSCYVENDGYGNAYNTYNASCPILATVDDYIVEISGSSGESRNVTILITAEFPDDDTGDSGDYNGDGWDDVCYEAGAESGDINGDGANNILDVVTMVDNILYNNNIEWCNGICDGDWTGYFDDNGNCVCD